MLFALMAVLAAAATDAAPAAPAAAPPAATAPAAAKPVQKAAADEVVCHTEQVTGSMFPKKVCRRKAEADAARADQQRALRDVQHPVGPRTN